MEPNAMGMSAGFWNDALLYLIAGFIIGVIARKLS